jgi:hypothetical protein
MAKLSLRLPNTFSLPLTTFYLALSFFISLYGMEFVLSFSNRLSQSPPYHVCHPDGGESRGHFHGLAKKDDFRGITAKNADQKRFFSNFIGLIPRP